MLFALRTGHAGLVASLLQELQARNFLSWLLLKLIIMFFSFRLLLGGEDDFALVLSKPERVLFFHGELVNIDVIEFV
jgi:hypothetical protein